MSLGLFNWTTDLSDEPEYPPLFDDLWAEDANQAQSALSESKMRCVVYVMHSYDRSVGKDRIGMMEFIGGPSYESIVKSFGEEEWGELESDLGSIEFDFMHMILNEPVLILFQSPEDFPQSLLPSDYEWDNVVPIGSGSVLGSNDFYYWIAYDWWICINRGWNAKIMKILEKNSPKVMTEFADCRVGRQLLGMTVGELKGLLKEAGKSVSGKKEDLVKRLIDNNPPFPSQ